MTKPWSINLNHAITLGLITAMTLGISACGESTSSEQGSQFSQSTTVPTPPTDNFNQAALVQNLTDNVIIPTYSKFVDLAKAQEQAVIEYCDALTTESTNLADLQNQAKQGWRDAMTVWQMAEVMQIGPLLDNNSSLRNKIYSWPNTSACAVDQDVVLAEQNNYDISSRTASRKGLDALEYLLFNANLNHSCTVFGTAPTDWDNRLAQDKAASRCEFAKLVANELVNDSQTLVDAWSGTTGYANILKTAGQIDSEFTDIHDAINDISDALFYIDSITKDAKIAVPLGLIANDCGLTPCVENTESQYAAHSLENIISNINGLNLIFQGGDDDTALGFEDYLIDVGANDTATQMRNDLSEVTVFASELHTSLNQLLEQQPEQVQEVHNKLKKVTDNMKTDFIQRLALELPATSAGDND